MKRKLMIVVSVFMALIQHGSAEVSYKVNYQGLLYTNNAPFNGTTNMAISIYSSSTGGDALYSETIGSVLVHDASYAFQFGTNSTDFLDALAGSATWLELTIGTNVLSREELVSVPYAIYASRVEGTLTGNQLTFNNGSYLKHDGTNLFLVSADGTTTNALTTNSGGGVVDPPPVVGEVVNIIQPENGGQLESFSSEYSATWGRVSALTDGFVDDDWTHGWFSAVNPTSPQSFTYSFSNDLPAVISNVVVHNFSVGDSRYSREYEISVSSDGENYNLITSGTLQANSTAQTIQMGNVSAKYIRFSVTSGYSSLTWALAELSVWGTLINDTTAPSPGTPACAAATNSPPIIVTYSGASDTGGSGLKHVRLLAQKNGGAVVDTGLTSTGSSGSFTYTGMTGSGTYTFSLQAEDNAGLYSAFPGISTVSCVYTAPPNSNPIASNDTATTSMNTPVTIDVLANDSDPDGSDVLAIDSYTTNPAAGGSVTNLSSTTLEYTPANGYTGEVSFTYVVTDQVGGLATGTVNVAVAGTSLYMLVDISGGSTATSYPVEYLTAEPADLDSNDAYKTTKVLLRLVRNGDYTIGAPGGSEFGQDSNDILLQDEPERNITLTKSFYCGVFEVTQAQYRNVTGGNPSAYVNDKFPVHSVSGNTIHGGVQPLGAPAATSFLGLLSAKTGNSFNLPTEARWEVACRAGTRTSLNSGKNVTALEGYCPNSDEVGWFRANTGGFPGSYREVGLKQPNLWGLYDMHGNAFEYVLDYYYQNPVVLGTVDPVGSSPGTAGGRQVSKGGTAFGVCSEFRSADRWGYFASTGEYFSGFRIVAETD